MKRMLAAIYVLLSILHGAKSAETEHVVEGMSAYKQLSLGHGRKMSAIVVDDLSTVVAASSVANRGTCTIANRLESGFARIGEAFRQTSAASDVHCARMCKILVAGCIAINYRYSDSTCFFLADPGYIYISPGYTTALVNPSLDNVCNSNNLIPGYDRPGGDMPDGAYGFETAIECCWKCVTTPGCIAYSKEIGTTSCLLKQGPPSLRQIPDWSTGLVCLD